MVSVGGSTCKRVPSYNKKSRESGIFMYHHFECFRGRIGPLQAASGKPIGPGPAEIIINPNRPGKGGAVSEIRTDQNLSLSPWGKNPAKRTYNEEGTGCKQEGHWTSIATTIKLVSGADQEMSLPLWTKKFSRGLSLC